MKQYFSGICFKIVQDGKQNAPGVEAGNGTMGVHNANCKVQKSPGDLVKTESDWAELGGPRSLHF